MGMAAQGHRQFKIRMDIQIQLILMGLHTYRMGEINTSFYSGTLMEGVLIAIKSIKNSV